MDTYRITVEVSHDGAISERRFTLDVDGRRTDGTVAADIVRLLKEHGGFKVRWPGIR